MQIPSYGAAPLSATFLVVRLLEFVSMVSIVGMTASLVSQTVGGYSEPPKEVVGTLTVTSIATLYCLVSIAFYWSQANIGLFVMGAVDSLLLIAFVVVAVTVGRPLSYLNCAMISKASSELNATSTSAWISSLAANLGKSGASLGLSFWAGATSSNCYVSKAIWGLSIALCLLFTTSAILLPTLWYKSKKAVPKSLE